MFSVTSTKKDSHKVKEADTTEIETVNKEEVTNETPLENPDSDGINITETTDTADIEIASENNDSTLTDVEKVDADAIITAPNEVAAAEITSENNDSTLTDVEKVDADAIITAPTEVSATEITSENNDSTLTDVEKVDADAIITAPTEVAAAEITSENNDSSLTDVEKVDADAIITAPTEVAAAEITSENNEDGSVSAEGIDADAVAIIAPQEVAAVDINEIKNDISQSLSTSSEADSKIIQKLLTSPLSLLSEAPESNIIFETRPAFTQYKNFISSDYFFEKLAITEKSGSINSTKRLGDGFLEQKMVRDQMLALTGKQTLPLYDNVEDLYQSLMENALAQHEDLALNVGVSLSPEQINQLSTPIVWMVEQTVDTPDGPVTALAPKVYLPTTMDMELRPDGSLIAANSMEMDLNGGFKNSGSVAATNSMGIKANQIENRGALISSGSIALDATADILNLSGLIDADKDLSISAGGNFTSETATDIITDKSMFGTTVQTLVGDTAKVSGDTVSVTAGNDSILKGSELEGINGISLDAVNDLTFAALDIENSKRNKIGQPLT